MRQFLHLSFILHIRPFKETSGIIHAFTKEFGIVSVVAKGFRRKKSPLKGVIQVFNPLLLSWVGTKDLKTLTGVESTGKNIQLLGKVLLSGLYMNELIVRLVKPYDAHPKLFDNYQCSIEKIANLSLQDDIEVALRVFENKLLTEIGYGIDLEKCPTDDGPIDPNCLYGFEPSIGIYKLDTSNKQNPSYSISGETLLALKNEKFNNKQQLKEAKYLMRAALRVQLGSKPLFSRELVRNVTQGVKSNG